MRIGAHQSIAGGLDRAIESACRDGCESIQIFTRNQSQWKAKPLTNGVVERERCSLLGIPYLVTHPGAHMGQGEAKGIELVSDAITRALARTSDAEESVTVLIEVTAGQGTSLGHRFEHIRDLLGGIEPKTRVGVCVDTCHVFAAGYDLSTDQGYEQTFKQMERVFGLENVRAFHLNDSKRPLGSRVDRHAGIGEGYIGRSAFARLVRDVRFTKIPGILELPPPTVPMLRRLRRMADNIATARRRPTARGSRPRSA
jgi:deoxyribonuclease-4